jgi:hypothetical protein
MRLHAVVCNISVLIYRFTSCSSYPNEVNDPAVIIKSIDTMADIGRYAILSDAVMSVRTDITFGPTSSQHQLGLTIYGD